MDIPYILAIEGRISSAALRPAMGEAVAKNEIRMVINGYPTYDEIDWWNYITLGYNKAILFPLVYSIDGRINGLMELTITLGHKWLYRSTIGRTDIQKWYDTGQKSHLRAGDSSYHRETPLEITIEITIEIPWNFKEIHLRNENFRDLEFFVGPCWFHELFMLHLGFKSGIRTAIWTAESIGIAAPQLPSLPWGHHPHCTCGTLVAHLRTAEI